LEERPDDSEIFAKSIIEEKGEIWDKWEKGEKGDKGDKGERVGWRQISGLDYEENKEVKDWKGRL
jgi:hypothetical protein